MCCREQRATRIFWCKHALWTIQENQIVAKNDRTVSRVEQPETLHVSKTISAKLEIADSAPINDSLLLLQGIGNRFNVFTPFIVLNGDCTESCPFLWWRKIE